MAEQDIRRLVPSWISDSIILAASPFAGYVVSFIYEFGYSQVFKIPLQLITINTTSIFVATVAVWVLLMGLMGYFCQLVVWLLQRITMNGTGCLN